ncbi:GGDEF domain-containing protein [Pseudazoarcus pumilus]|uniref:Sensor domain-containing diguanylate cyclase n=1 Tax=Pseudazoarcus pumilus TaxID=2067960 RepID=A0A2I6SAJ0_9RHOO|nr:sensor domain-containing diguanylate cyclase [Pseudazoarcus pumilus]AUN96262.1 sensor domain-containing diguanylate cyclase [Pseudazoarcus pumilus]
MSRPPTPENEFARLAVLHRFGILDTPREAAFDALTRIAAHICEVPIAVINFIDRDRQWFKSEIGLGTRETPLDVSICAHAILQPGLFVVPDTLEDPRFANNPLVAGEPGLRFYAGALLETDDGYPLGTLCVLDHEPRTLTPEQGEILEALAAQVMLLLSLYEHNAKQAEMLAELDRARHEMALLAATDSLTGLANRRAFTERLDQEIARLARSGGASCLLMADLDDFKPINDHHGHQAGDHALTVFASLCTGVFRESDYIARWGGDEFMVLLPDTDKQAAMTGAERLHTALASTPIGGDAQDSFSLGASIGIVEFDGSPDADTVLQAVDETLYAAKNDGPGRTAVG